MFLGYKKSGFPLGKKSVYVGIAIIILLLSLVVFIFVFLPIIHDPETSGLALFVSLYYPIADILILIPASILIYITSLFGKSKISWPWRFIALGICGFTISDLAYSFMVWQGTYDSGSIVDLGWNLGYLFFALAGLYQKQLVEAMKGGMLS